MCNARGENTEINMAWIPLEIRKNNEAILESLVTGNTNSSMSRNLE